VTDDPCRSRVDARRLVERATSEESYEVSGGRVSEKCGGSL